MRSDPEPTPEPTLDPTLSDELRRTREFRVVPDGREGRDGPELLA
jgi:hypothetical protein